MYKLSKFFLVFLCFVLVNASPFIKDKQIAPDVDENKNEKSEDKNIYRLSDQVIPMSYELRIIPDLETFTFRGSVKITILVKDTTKKIELHSKKLTINEVQVSKGARPIEKDYKLDEENDLLTIETKLELSYNTEYTLTIDFQGLLSEDMKGFYKSSYVLNDNEYWLAATQFEPTYAREAFPCFDEPRFKAKFIISIAHLPSQKAISNMPIEKESADPAHENRRWTQFEESPLMATYLVAFIVSEFSSITDDEKRINVWARKNAIESCSYALKQSVKLLKNLEDYTGIAHALPKLDVVAIPDFKIGAMENWGMTTYREKYVVLDETQSAESHKSAVTEIISHEFSHQWFGDLVTPAWWDYLWLNEGFATYFEYFAAAGIETTWRLPELFVVEVVQRALWEEVKVQRPMTASITTKKAIEDAFDIISYEKAGSIIKMFEHIFTPGPFKACIHNYLNKRGVQPGSGTVVPANLFEEFEEQAYIISLFLPPGKQVTEIFEGWTKNIGYPLITVTRDKTTQKIIIKQSTYQSPRAPGKTPDQEWIVPLTYTTKSEHEFSNTKPSLWLLPHKEIELPKEVASTDWVIFNLQQSGYYRVNYDSNNWDLLINQLHENPKEIHVLNRAQIIDDSMAMARDGLLSFHESLRIIQYLPKEFDWIPWYSAITHLNALFNEYQSTSLENNIGTFIKQIIQEPYKNFGFDIKATDDHITKLVKPLFLGLACKVGAQGCAESVLEQYTKNKDDLSKIQPDLKKVVFCNILRSSINQQEVFNDLWSTYLKSNFAYDKNMILMSISCTKDEEITKKIISKLIDSKNKEIRKQDRIFFLRTFSSSSSSINGAISFLLDAASKTSELTDDGISTMKDILDKLKSNVKTEAQIKLLKEAESKYQTLDKQKFGDLTKLIKSAYEQGIKTKEETEKNIKKFAPVLNEFIPTSESTTTQSPKASSAPSTSMFSLWQRAFVIGISLYYSSLLLKVF